MKIFKKIVAVLVAFAMSFTLFALAACTPDDAKKPSKNAALIKGVLSQENGTVQIDLNYCFDEKTELTMYLNSETGEMDSMLVTSVYDGGELSPDSVDYGFWRGGKIFSFDFYQNVEENIGRTDFSDCGPFVYEDMGYIEEVSDYYGLALRELLTDELNQFNYYVLCLADEFGALTVNGDNATLDLNKLAYSVISEVDALVSSLDLTSTLGDVLESNFMRKMFSPITSLITPVELKAYILGILEENGVGDMLEELNINVDALLGNPSEKGDTYDYILELLDSEALITVLGALTGGSASARASAAPSGFLQFPISTLLAMAEIDLKTLKETVSGFKEVVRANSIVTEIEGAVLTIENAVINYAFKDGAIIGQTVSADVGCEYKGEELEASFGLTVKYNVDYDFIDINDYYAHNAYDTDDYGKISDIIAGN